MKTASGIGIAALVVAIVSLLIPIYGLYTGLLALLLACVAAYMGDKGLVIATVILSFFGYFFLSPSLALAEYGQEGSTATFWILIYALLAAPLLCMWAAARKKTPAPTE